MKEELNFQEKLEVAQWITDNNNAAITGSIMLRLLGVDLGREPDDIDIIVDNPDLELLITPPLCVDKKTEVCSGYKVLRRCYFMGTKIEFILVDKVRRKTLKQGDKSYNVARVKELVEAKERYVIQDKNEDYIEKTKNDLTIIRKFLSENENILKDQDRQDGTLVDIG